MGRLVIGTKNPDKAAEILEILAGSGIEVVDDAEWPDVVESGSTLEENARLKARAVRDATGIAALADDSGLEVDALEGGPGVRSARFAGPASDHAANREALLAALEGRADRGARFRTVVVVALPGEDELVTEGTLEGEIAMGERGELGFGYDSVFELPDGRTLAEVSTAEKNRVSHRARALEAVLPLLRRRLGTGD